MPRIRLSNPLPDEATLYTFNRQLRVGAAALDWSDVEGRADSGTLKRGLEVLLAGLDGSADADALGLETVPDALTEMVESVLDAEERKLRRARTRKAAKRTPSAQPTVWQPGPDDGNHAAPSDADAVALSSQKPEDPPDTGAPTPPGESITPVPRSSVLDHPTPAQLRAELERAVITDLLGPAGGPEEEVDERAVRDRYLVGTLAPLRKAIEPEEHEAVVHEGVDSPEDGTADVVAPQGGSMFPSSIGMSFCVDGGLAALRVTTRWGHYRRQPSAHLLTEEGNPQRVWKRVPVEATSTPIALREGALDSWTVDPRWPEVIVRGLARRYDDDWIVTLFLVNGQLEPKKSKDTAWLFQPELVVEADGQEDAFVRRPARLAIDHGDEVVQAESDAMAMLYRDHVEFAVGHGVSVHAELSEGTTQRARRLTTRAVPAHEVPVQSPPTAADRPALADLVLDMKVLADTPQDQLEKSLRALPKAYKAWIDEQRERLDAGDEGLDVHQAAGSLAMDRCAEALERIRDGISLVASDRQAADAFRFANRAMWQQRVRSIYAERVRRGEKPVFEDVDVPAHRTWYAFQLGFVLLNLASVTNLYHRDRTHETEAIADLLWFPTGGGKTEAYLGLAAYTMGLRRLQGTVAGRDGAAGVAVLMRYTLRLLTLQQFQRATALVCACEAIRRETAETGDHRWGAEPFRIGLWVGMHTTPNRTADADEWIRRGRGQFKPGGGAGGGGSPAQLTYCPWCGAAIDPGKDIKVEPFRSGVGRTFLYCGDPRGRCLFTRRQSPDEGIPAVVVDEEIYRRLPTLLIATVDKFAQLPWNGVTQTLFGQVIGRCTRHGFRSPDLDDSDTHPKRGPLQAARTVPQLPLRPPDLIIQDELHLISGPLGTLTGLYETAIDELCSWEVGGKRVRPKVVASTATIRRAIDQVHALFLRKVSVFPPHGLDVSDSFFSLERDTASRPGRRYLGICAPGRRLKVAQIRVFVALLAAGQQLYERYGKDADPWMTMVGYFNAIRELAGGRRLLDDDVRARLRRTDRRGLVSRRPPLVEELTSRKSSGDIPWLLDRMEVPFDPIQEEQRLAQLKKTGKTRIPRPLDALLATNMISVGVDVKRLGLMSVIGQPKTTAEYIQATSRVGRSAPGLVVAIYNWARPRDLSHYETFEHYHATFYQHVEAISVTPFAARAIDRGLSALLIALVRLGGETFNGNERAEQLKGNHALVKRAIGQVARRAELVSGDPRIGVEVRQMLQHRVDSWLAEAARDAGGTNLGYRSRRDGTTRCLLQSAASGPWQMFSCLNSLRDVEPTVGLVLEDGGLDEGAILRTSPSPTPAPGTEGTP